MMKIYFQIYRFLLKNIMIKLFNVFCLYLYICTSNRYFLEDLGFNMNLKENETLLFS